MTSNKTEGLIVELAADLVPVSVLPSVSVRFSRWLIGAAIAAGLWVAVFGLRADALAALLAPPVLMPLTLALIASIGAGVAAIRLSVPGVNSSWWGRWAPAAALGVLAAVLIGLVRTAGGVVSEIAREPLHMACVLRVIAIGLVPAALLARAVWKGFPLHRMAATALTLLGGCGLGAAAVQFVCPIDRPAHLLLSHVMPVIGLVMLGALAAKLVMTWDRDLIR